MDKKELRERIKQDREKYSQEEIDDWNSSIKKSLEEFVEYQEAETVFFYVSFGREVDTTGLIKDALSSGKYVVVPYYDGKSYSISYLTDFNDLEPGRLGILEPKKDKIHEADLESIDVMIIPGLAFDKQGNRVGYGEGNYDNFMKNTCAMKIALCYNFQLFEDVPHKEHDVPINMIITQDKILRC